ncbi:hypothetical protein [Parasutterella sp.]|uniref:hypothetical protein n=1 Tax=Parasutterella sp. TaxID=2049037 RepID=UPI0035212945
MGYNRYIYSDATLKAKAANNKAGLLKNKKRSDIVAYGTELVLSQIKYEPKSYLEYGPYWWAMKKVINARGGNLGDTMDEEIAIVYKGSSDEETFTAAFMFMEYYLDFLFNGCRSFQLEDGAEEWILRDPDIENRWPEPLPSIFD